MKLSQQVEALEQRSQSLERLLREVLATLVLNTDQGTFGALAKVDAPTWQSLLNTWTNDLKAIRIKEIT